MTLVSELSGTGARNGFGSSEAGWVVQDARKSAPIAPAARPAAIPSVCRRVSLE